MSEMMHKYSNLSLEGDHDVCTECGGSVKIVESECEVEGTEQTLIITIYQCRDCKRMWYDKERDWT
jgi:hypothetical protein